MKKIMIMAVVAMAAIVSQAATVNWASAQIKAPTSLTDGTKGTANANGANFYLFSISAEQYTALMAQSYADASASIWSTFGGESLPTTAAGALNANGVYTHKETVADKAGEIYRAFIYTYEVTAEVDGVEQTQLYYQANIGTAYVTGSGAVTGTAKLGTTWAGTSGGAIGAWTAVPEPTSGLLMLVGLAGLALRRRRA